MSKIKTKESSFSLGRGWTQWNYNAEYDYARGICYTPKGIIDLYVQGERKDIINFRITARIIHRGRSYDLSTTQKVTRLGWVRIVKKWANKIRKKR